MFCYLSRIGAAVRGTNWTREPKRRGNRTDGPGGASGERGNRDFPVHPGIAGRGVSNVRPARRPRRGRTNLAHGFSRGFTAVLFRLRPVGTHEGSRVPTGRRRSGGIEIPPLKRWATFNRPYGTIAPTPPQFPDFPSSARIRSRLGSSSVIPAKAGTQGLWIPACAGMTVGYERETARIRAQLGSYQQNSWLPALEKPRKSELTSD